MFLYFAINICDVLCARQFSSRVGSSVLRGKRLQGSAILVAMSDFSCSSSDGSVARLALEGLSESDVGDGIDGGMSDAASDLSSVEDEPSGLPALKAVGDGDAGFRAPSSDDDGDAADATPTMADGCVAIAPCGWAVGLNVGNWIHGLHAPLSEQAQVLVANLCATAQRMGVAWCKSVFEFLRPQAVRSTSYLYHAVSALCRVPDNLLRTTMEKLAAHNWVPAAPIGRALTKRKASELALDAAAKRNRDLKAMRTLVRECLGKAAEGHSDCSFSRSLSRMQVSEVAVGQRYHSAHFAEECESLAMHLVRHCTLARLRQELPGLGIPTDYALVWDGVSIGAKQFARNETLLLLGCRGSHAGTGRAVYSLLAAPALPMRHTGAAKVQLIFDSLADLPAGGISLRDLRRSFVIGGGDGAEVRGGERARHKSTNTAGKLFTTVHGDAGIELAFWDLFHRDEIAGRWAFKAVPMALEVYDVAAVLVQLFGTGAGRHVLRAAAKSLADDRESVSLARVEESRSTRPLAYTQRVTESMYRNYRCYARAFDSREVARRGEGQGSSTQKALLSAGRRLFSFDFAVFLLALRDLSKRVFVPLSARNQRQEIETADLQNATTEAVSSVLKSQEAMSHVRRHVVVSALLASCVSARNLCYFWHAFRYSQWGRLFPSLLCRMPEILHFQRLRGVGLIGVPLTEAEAMAPTHHILHPACQCDSMTQKQRLETLKGRASPRGHSRRREVTIAGRAVMIPEWSAADVWHRNKLRSNAAAAPDGIVLPRFRLVEKERAPPLQLQERPL